MKNRTALSLAISLVMACPTALQALGLGELHSSSQLNQPLRAKIDLLSTSASQASQLKVRLASADVFRRVGIDRPAYLDNLRFTPTVSNGKPVIRVTSNTPISEPFLNFLLEVSWPQGQLLKEYTVLLDPPVLLQSGNVTADNSASVRAEPKPATAPRVNQRQVAEQQRRQQQLEQQRQQQIRIQQQQRQRQQQAVTAEQRRARAQQELFEAQALSVLNERTSIASTTTVRKRATPTRSRSKYRVRRGDTMSRVATKLRYRGVSTSQMMIALFRANPHAFSNGNVNNLKAGVLLSRPSKNSVNRTTSDESKQLILQHFAQWKKYRSGVANNTVAQKNIKASSPRTEPVQPKISTDDNDKASLKVAGRTGVKSIDQAVDQNNATLQQKVFLAQEALASSRSENAELGSRVSKLEAIIRKKDRLINLKNERLAKLESQLSGATRVTEPQDLVNQVANEADQASNRIIRTEEGSLGDIANNIAKNTLKTEPERASNPFVNEEKEEASEGLLGFLSSPLVAAIGGGSLLALLFGWLLMRRSSRNSIQDVGASIDDEFFDDELDNDSHNNQLDNYIDDADHNTIVDDSFEDNTQHDDGEFEQGFDELLATEDNSEDDEIVQEADVYIVYGLYDQAEDELVKAIKNNPEKMIYRHKLLETYKVSGNKEAFVRTAKDFLEAKGDNKDKYWESITGWGKKLAPDEKMFANSTAKKALVALGGTAAVGAAVKVASDAFSGGKDNFESKLSDTEDYTLDGDFDTTLGLDPKAVGETISTDDFNLDLDDDLDFGLDEKLDAAASKVTQKVDDSLDLDFGLDEKLDAAASKVTQKVDDSLDLDFDLGDEVKLPSLDSNVKDKSILNFTNPENETLFDGDTPDFNVDKNALANAKMSSEDSIDDALSFLDLTDDTNGDQENISTKLDLARAYLDMGDVEGARNTLEEVVIEGNDDQKREAEALLQQTG